LECGGSTPLSYDEGVKPAFWIFFLSLWERIEVRAYYALDPHP